MKVKILLSFILALICSVASAQVSQLQPFVPMGNTVTFTANTSGNIPTPVQATTTAGIVGQYLVANVGTSAVFVSYATTSALATTNCVVPTGTSTATFTMLPSSIMVITVAPNSYFCGITTSGTSAVYITPGQGT